MLSVFNLSVQFGKRILFDNVNIKFTPGNCYGIIGANGSGKSTFLKILSGKMEANSGNISLEPGKRLSVLEQDHNSHNEYTIIDTVLRGNKILYDIKNEMENIYSKSDFSDKDGERVGELQAIYEDAPTINIPPIHRLIGVLSTKTVYPIKTDQINFR